MNLLKKNNTASKALNTNAAGPGAEDKKKPEHKRVTETPKSGAAAASKAAGLRTSNDKTGNKSTLGTSTNSQSKVDKKAKQETTTQSETKCETTRKTKVKNDVANKIKTNNNNNNAAGPSNINANTIPPDSKNQAQERQPPGVRDTKQKAAQSKPPIPPTGNRNLTEPAKQASSQRRSRRPVHGTGTPEPAGPSGTQRLTRGSRTVEDLADAGRKYLNHLKAQQAKPNPSSNADAARTKFDNTFEVNGKIMPTKFCLNYDHNHHSQSGYKYLSCDKLITVNIVKALEKAEQVPKQKPGVYPIPKRSFYENGISTDSKVLVATNNERKYTHTMHWSGAVIGQVISHLGKNKDAFKHIERIVQVDIENEDWQKVKDSIQEKGTERMIELKPGAPGFNAMLGTDNGRGIVYLLAENVALFGKSAKITKILVGREEPFTVVEISK